MDFKSKNNLNTENKGDKPFERIYRDFMVMVNNSYTVSDIETGETYDISSYVVSVNVNYNLDSPPATCDITMRTPRHAVEGADLSFSLGDSLKLKEMDEIRVFFKNRFPFKGSGYFGKNKGAYGYSHAFWGVVTRIVDVDNANENSITLSCHDMTWWLSKMRMNIHASAISNVKKRGPNSTIYGDLNPFGIVSYILKYYPEDLDSNTTKDQITQGTKKNLEAEPYKNWVKRYQDIQKRVKLIGVNGYTDQKTTKTKVDLTRKHDKIVKSAENPVEASKAKNIETKKYIYAQVPELDEELLEDIKPYFVFKATGVFESEFKNRLDILMEVAQFIGFEFFQDTTGDIYFKPPYYNMYVSENENPIYVIDRLDLIEADFSSDANDVITELSGTGSRSDSLINSDSNASVFGLYRDSQLTSIYGIQESAIKLSWARNSEQVLLFLIGEMDRINAKRFTSSVQIEGRPELRLGRPIYLPWRDSFYYIRGISHSFSNGSFKTTLDLDSRRRKYREPGKVEIVAEGIVEYEAKYMPDDKKKMKLDTIIQSGIPKYSTGSLNHIEIKNKKIKKPASDQFGYELIGAFGYGKNLMLDARGKVVKRVSSPKVESLASMGMAPQGVYSIEKQDDHPDINDSDFSSENDFIKDLYGIGRKDLIKK